MKSPEVEAIIPQGGGIYCIGQTNYCPIDNSINYYIKVGVATDFHKRMRQYKTHNPHFWKIDFRNIDGNNALYAESMFHAALHCIGSNLPNMTTDYEWYEVSAEIYKQICEEGLTSSVFQMLNVPLMSIPRLKALL